MPTAEELAEIKRVPLFAQLRDEVLIAVAELGDNRKVARGEIIFHQEESGAEMYVVISGTVRLHANEGRGELEIPPVTPGDYFGEMSIIDGSVRSTNATVTEDGELFVLEREALFALLARFPELLERVLMRFTHNIRQRNAHVFGLVAEKEMLKEQGELDRLRSLSQMVAGVAHEINTPLGIIQNAASLVSEILPKNQLDAIAKDAAARETLADVVEACDLIQRNATNAARLVQAFKSLSVRQIAEQRETADIVAVVTEALDLYKLKARSSNRMLVIHSDLIASERVCESYPGHLVQVVLNLVQNADTYAYREDQSGTIEVSIGAATLPVKGTAVPAFELLIADRGAGIASENLPRIFEPFFTTGRARGGTGLGLAIVHNLVTESLGGTLRVESTVGQGTTFFIRLPKSAPTKNAEGAH